MPDQRGHLSLFGLRTLLILQQCRSIVIVLRLWRVFKIIEEFSSGAEEQVSIKHLRNPAVDNVY